MNLTLDEIKDWAEFENLVASFFRLQDATYPCEIVHSGKGADGGKDMLLIFNLRDSVDNYERKWVVQCKFYNRDLRKSDLSDVNIPTLIHEHGADGYLLVTKKGVVNTLQTMFENLEKNCILGYEYRLWTGTMLLDFIINNRDIRPAILKRYFPKHYQSIK